MPVEFLTDEEADAYRKFAEEPTRPEAERFLFLNDVERDLLARRRSMHHQLGFAPQMCMVRYIDRSLPGDPLEAPWPVVAEGNAQGWPASAVWGMPHQVTGQGRGARSGCRRVAGGEGHASRGGSGRGGGGCLAGVRDTAFLVARMGGASNLGRRETGILDPGAVGVALLLASAGGSVDTLAHRVTTG